MTLTEFLTARLDEDEANLRDDDWCSGDGGLHVISTRWHERLVAEVAAKRRIVELHGPDRVLENWYWSQRKCRECGGLWHKWIPDKLPTDIGPEQGCPTLRALATVYADHPDFDPSWA